MALTKTRTVDKIEILRNGVMQVREAVEVFDDAELIGQKYIRSVFVPTTPLVEIPFPRVRAIGNLIWTPAVIDAYKAEIAATPAPILT